MNRRDFFRTSLAGAAALSALKPGFVSGGAAGEKSTIILVKTQDRAQGVAEIFRRLSFPSAKGKSVLIKPNFNTKDPAPGSTHNDTLRALVLELKKRGASRLTLGESSGPPATKSVLEAKGIPALAEELGFAVVNFEDLPVDGWTHFNPEGNHWSSGFDLPKIVVDSEYLVSTCCLKTHGFGGHYSMSMKLAVGLTPKPIRRELHSKRDTDMRKMIAELNLGYRPQVIVMDGVDVFVDGGPSTGKLINAGLFVGGTDRVAVDAVGVAILKHLGSNATIMSKPVFEQDQIKRAVEIGLGVGRPDQIEIIGADGAAREIGSKLESILRQE